LLLGVAYAFAIPMAKVDLGALWEGLPRMAGWVERAWPPDLTGLPLLLRRAAETMAMAFLGTTIAINLAGLTCVFAARNITSARWLRVPARLVLDFFRAVDSFVFAILFVAAVGLGPFAGVLGIALHTWGSTAKLFSETIEATPKGPLEAMAASGANKIRTVRFALLPDVMPGLTSIGLYMFEFNIRASTVLGIVGAGGLGQELKSSMDLLNFPRVAVIIALILVMVTGVDQLSAYLRRRIT
jgi:phosphonate transport system permease protein